jgi:hypothetical protein
MDTSAEQGELGELKKRYSSQLTTLKELFPDWTDADLVLAIEEADGDLERTVERISEGEHPPVNSLHSWKTHEMYVNVLNHRHRLSVQRGPQEGQGPITLQSNKGEPRPYRVIHYSRRTRRCSPTRS